MRKKVAIKPAAWRLMLMAWARHFSMFGSDMAGVFELTHAGLGVLGVDDVEGGDFGLGTVDGAQGGDAGHGGLITEGDIFGAVGEQLRQRLVQGAHEAVAGAGGEPGGQVALVGCGDLGHVGQCSIRVPI